MSETELQAAGGAVHYKKRARILIMDDETSILELTSRMLALQGYEIETACDGDSTVAQYKAAMDSGNGFDALILDLTVPEGMNGYDTFKAVRELDPGVKAILSTGYSHDPVVINYKSHGIAGVALKPYKVKELFDAVRDVLGV